MEGNLGQLVLNRKPKLSQDLEKVLGHNVPMDKYAKKAWAAAMISRTRQARAMANPKIGQTAMGEALGMSQGKYKWYEIRTPMPTIYHKKFCEICGCSLEWFRSGEGSPVPPQPSRRERAA